MNGAASVVGSIAEARPWLAAAAVLVSGMVVAVLLRVVLSKLLVLVRLNALCDRIGVSEFLRKGRARNTPARLVAILVFWVVLVYSFFQIARILDIGVLRSVSDRIAEFAPGVVAALFIGAIGLVVVAFLANFVETLARNAAYPHARLLARAVRVGGGLIITVLALEQLHLSGTLLSSLVLVLVAGLALGCALAFGLGCKDLAREAVLKILAELRERSRASKGTDLEG